MDLFLEFSQNSSELSQDFFPPLMLKSKRNYVLGLYSLATYNSIPNIKEDENNIIIFEKPEDLTPELRKNVKLLLKITPGSHKLESIADHIKIKAAEAGIHFHLALNTTTRKPEIRCTHEISLHPLSIGHYLGFEGELTRPDSSTNISKEIFSEPIIINIQAGVNDEIVFYETVSIMVPKLEIIRIPAGSYEILLLGEYLKKKTRELNIDFSLALNPSTMRVEMYSDHKVIFPQNSVRRFIGFQNDFYPSGLNISEAIPHISNINIINVECNIVGGSFRNGKISHSLYTFAPNVPTGYKLIERPSNILFLPVNDRLISNITLRLTDQSGKLVILNKEEVTIHLVLRELKNGYYLSE